MMDKTYIGPTNLHGTLGVVMAVILIVFLIFAAWADGGESPHTPRNVTMTRHQWRALRRQERREGIDPGGSSEPEDSTRPVPQSRYSNRR